jgi:hypothetical protein
MNKLLVAAGTAALGLISTAPASTLTSTAEAKGSLLQLFFNYLRLRKTARLKTDPAVSVDSQLIDEKGWEYEKQQSPLYDLAANNSHVIAASLFSRKYR